MIPSYFRTEILALRDKFVTQGHKGLIFPHLSHYFPHYSHYFPPLSLYFPPLSHYLVQCCRYISTQRGGGANIPPTPRQIIYSKDSRGGEGRGALKGSEGGMTGYRQTFEQFNDNFKCLLTHSCPDSFFRSFFCDRVV